jgi:hypothetical protein
MPSCLGPFGSWDLFFVFPAYEAPYTNKNKKNWPYRVRRQLLLDNLVLELPVTFFLSFCFLSNYYLQESTYLAG